ncbi:MAG: phosphopantothenate/pantothenate synthetase [Gemmatimonadetes bacterium]|jgi:4-phosphopantoate---beta-alanine ligase|nr:phosphopantothenate/pantothenate synthetase [Gemmatimonadota bacterium]MBT6149234.1 phosphopantothenate/pantothenate synthetase [Gemmatimonadota bacterium]MBT7862693.1 phosphopantothenate/pantothenate synthetase [Gemmatimonadota bacterium]
MLDPETDPRPDTGSDVPESHPRYLSLKLRDAIVAGVDAGMTSVHGLIAHGRGEAFDYLLGEVTGPWATTAIEASAARLLTARHAVLSVNGNAAALVGAELVALSRVSGAPLEVNVFHTSADRERAIADGLRRHGAEEVLLPDADTVLPGLDSNRRFVHPRGILEADVIFVPLEDGDRCQALRQLGREVITVDLNPLSRTARTASMTIVDNVARALPLLVECVEALAGRSQSDLQEIWTSYDHAAILAQAEARIRNGAD